MKKYCALVVWYNPPEDVLKNTSSYIDAVECLYIIDNSKSDNSWILERYEFADKCRYICLRENTGLAYALDYGCRLAIRDNYDYVLTMDQDSLFEPGAAEMLVQYAEGMDEKRYCIVCPNVISIYNDVITGEEKMAYINWPRGQNREMLWTMTSGSLMSLRDYGLIQGFDKGLFIQHVDVDLGIQFSALGLHVIALGDAILRQRFGNSRPQKLLWKTVHPSHDNPVRTYYRFRNQVYMEKKYGRKVVMKVCNAKLWTCVVKDILFEEQKIERLHMMLRGFIDGKKGRMGAFEG